MVLEHVHCFSIAEHFTANPPEYSIILVAFDAEEDGLIGSKHFINKPPVSLKKIIFNLNMDMVSRDEDQEIFICGTHHYKKLIPLLHDVDSLSKIKVTYGHDSGAMRSEDWTHASDHGSFHKKNIPFVYLGVEDHEDYHQPTDVFEHIDQQFYIEAVRVAIRIIERVDLSKVGLK
ncbi:MAG: M28 family peptidase [Flavobacteriales bacterium]|nr:M28 family peptidase [Flavobacteriales bacterium]